MMHICENPSKYFEYNAKTRKLLVILALLGGLTVFLLFLPSSRDIRVGDGDQIQTGVYLRASKSEQKLLTLSKKNFAEDEFTLVLLNPGPAKVLAIFNGYKLKTVNTVSFLNQMQEKVANDESAAYYSFFVYFITASVLPAGKLTFDYNNGELMINGALYSEGIKTFKLLCELLV
jgi:hypothetical protein